MEWRSTMKRPTKKAFYEHMSEKLNRKYKDNNGYMDLLDIAKLTGLLRIQNLPSLNVAF